MLLSFHWCNFSISCWCLSLIYLSIYWGFTKSNKSSPLGSPFLSVQPSQSSDSSLFLQTMRKMERAVVNSCLVTQVSDWCWGRPLLPARAKFRHVHIFCCPQTWFAEMPAKDWKIKAKEERCFDKPHGFLWLQCTGSSARLLQHGPGIVMYLLQPTPWKFMWGTQKER